MPGNRDCGPITECLIDRVLGWGEFGDMKFLPLLVPMIICSLFATPLPSRAEPETKAPGKAAPAGDKKAEAAAEVFLAEYIKADAKNVEWMAKSKLVTKEFKDAFKKEMTAEEVDADPVLFAQDVPSTPFKAVSSTVKGKVAKVVVAAKFGEEPYRLRVTLVSTKDGEWLVAKTAPSK